MVTTTAELHSPKPELRFCASPNPAHDVLEIYNGEISEYGLAGNNVKRFSSVGSSAKTINYSSSSP